MPQYAKKSDLEKFRSDILDFEASSYNAELTYASKDVLNKIKSGYYPQAASSYGLKNVLFDEAKLNTAELVNITCYRALSAYIYPSLSKFSDGDSLLNLIEYYSNRFHEEWMVIIGLSLYDFNNDGSFTDSDIVTTPRRIFRA